MNDAAPQRRWSVADEQAANEPQPTVRSVIADLRKVPLARTIVTSLIIVWAILLARFSWEAPISETIVDDQIRLHFPARSGEPRVAIPIATDAERALYDWRATWAERRRPVDQDPRFLLVPYTQDTLEATAKRSPLDRTILAKALANIDAMGAKSIGIDILIDQPQPEDATLLTAMKAMKTPTHLAYASRIHAPGEIEQWQQIFMDRWFAALRGSQVEPASIRLEVDSDDVLRRWPAVPSDLPTFLPYALASTKPGYAYTGSIQYRTPVQANAKDQRKVFNSLPIDNFANPELAPLLASQVKDRIVMIGGDLPDRDRFEITSTASDGNDISGLEAHATLTAQLLDGRLPSRPGPLSLWVLAALVVLCGAFTAMLDVRPWVVAIAVVGQLVFFIAAPFLFQMTGTDTYGLPAFGWLGGWLLAYAATGAAMRALGSEQRRYAQSALGKYLPKDIAAQILRDPAKLSLTGEKKAIFTLFTDIEGFTAMSHKLPPERVASLLNAYLDGMCDVVLEHGGTIDKFVGDAVVAFWGAPIARPDDGARAIAALNGMLAFTQGFADQYGPDARLIGRTRIGLHYGEAVVGNFGGEGRLSYTALGDSMNCAARLEGANKYLKTLALISDEARVASGVDELRPMGRIALSGRDTPIVVWEPALGLSPDQRAELARLWFDFDQGNRAAVDELERICLVHEDDAAFAAFCCRLREAGPGGTTHLKEK